MLPYCTVLSIFSSAGKYTAWKNPKSLSDIYPHVNILIFSNVTWSYYILFHVVYMSILLLYIIEVPWADVSAHAENNILFLY